MVALGANLVMGERWEQSGFFGFGELNFVVRNFTVRGEMAFVGIIVDIA